jgi:hypothetical protein
MEGCGRAVTCFLVIHAQRGVSSSRSGKELRGGGATTFPSGRYGKQRDKMELLGADRCDGIYGCCVVIR